MKKKIFAIMVAVIMLVAMLPMTAMAEVEVPQSVTEYFGNLESNGLEFEYIVKPSPMTSVRNLLVDWVNQADEELNNGISGHVAIVDVKADETSDNITINYSYMNSSLESAQFTTGKIPVTFCQNVDSKLLEKINGIMKKYRESMMGQGSGFRLEDIDLIKYILDGHQPGEFKDYTRQYSTDYRKATNNANFVIVQKHTGGAGGGSSKFYVNDTESTHFYYKGILYASIDNNLVSGKVLYVPKGTAADKYIEVAKKRIKDATGEDVEIKLTQSLEAFANDEIADGKRMAEEHQVPYSGPQNYEEWKQQLIRYTNITLGANDEQVYSIKVKDSTYEPFLIIANDEKMAETTFTTTDIATDISIFTEDKTVSKDSLIAVEKVSEDEQADLLKKIGVKDGESFDISIGNIDGNITKLANGKFLVSIPVPAELEGKTLSAYYVTTDGKVEEHPATVKNGFATFETDHFSTYTLAEGKEVPKTADANNMLLWIVIALAAINLTTCTVLRVKRTNK